MVRKSADIEYSERETAKRGEAALKRMLATPHKPHAESKMGNPSNRRKKSPKKSKPKGSMALVASVRSVDAQNKLVEVTWAEGNRSGRTDVVDLSPLIDTHRFYSSLRNNAAMFDTIHIIDNGEAVGWADDAIDMSAESIERLTTADASG